MNYLTELQSNPVVLGAIMLFSGVAMSKLSAVSSAVMMVMKKVGLCHIEVVSTDPFFEDVRVWLHGHPSAKKIKWVSASTVTSGDYEIAEYVDKSLVLTPSIGSHLIKHNGKRILINMVRKEVTSESRDAKPLETIRLTFFGRNRESVNRVLDSIRLEAEHFRSKPFIYSSGYSDWERIGVVKSRDPESVFLYPGVYQQVTQDIENFMASADYYNQHGIPYRRGYMFYGEPGTGKTTLVTTLASKYNLSIYSAQLKGDNPNTLTPLFCRVKPGSILLMEDIDGYYSGRESKNGSYSYSSLLNALDGLAAPQGIIVIMTTNKREVLDDALLRPGRIDVSFYFGPLCAEQIISMLSYYAFDVSDELSLGLITDTVLTQKVTPAEFQGFMLVNRGKKLAEIVNLAQTYSFHTATETITELASEEDTSPLDDYDNFGEEETQDYDLSNTPQSLNFSGARLIKRKQGSGRR